MLFSGVSNNKEATAALAQGAGGVWRDFLRESPRITQAAKFWVYSMLSLG